MKIAVVGGGASGLMAACRLTDAQADVTLFESGERVGRKLAITGKGRCNLTNLCDEQTALTNVPTNPKFLYSAMRAFPPADVMRYFEETLGVPLKVERGNRVFPVSDRASEIVRALQGHAEKGGCRFIYKRVSSLKSENGAIKGLIAQGVFYPFDAVILCCGGCSYPLTGSDGRSYRLATELGHEIKPPRPSLVPLECEGEVCRALMGLSLKNTALTLIDRENGSAIYTDFGELLFTHFGLSGPTVLSASAHIKEMKRGRYEIRLDLKPALDEQTLDRRLLSDFEKYKNRDLIHALDDLLPSKMIPVIIDLCPIDRHKKVHEITKAERRALLTKLKDLRFTVKGFRPIDEAIVTSGGVKVGQISPSTMESRLVKGLYFAGEMLDVDAYTGGFNLQIAFCTAFLAAKSVLEGGAKGAGDRADMKKKTKKTKADTAADKAAEKTEKDCGKDSEKRMRKEPTQKTEEKQKKMNVAVDGPSGAGKSTLAKGLAKHYGLIYVDTGALYRTVGLYAQRQGISLEQISKVIPLLDGLRVGLTYENGEQRVILFEEDVTPLIRTPEISMYASAVSALPEVRAFLLETQRRLAREHSVVMDGRDIGTVILPDANVKIFLVANDRERAARRCRELLAKGVQTTVEEVLADMKKRDENDRSRAAAPAIPAEDAILLDNSGITLEETIEAAIAIIDGKMNA